MKDILIRKVNEIKTSSSQQKLSDLTSFVIQLAIENAPQAKVYGICTVMGRSTEM